LYTGSAGWEGIRIHDLWFYIISPVYMVAAEIAFIHEKRKSETIYR